MIVPPSRPASSIASADLPLAVGPAMSATRGFEDPNMFIATLIASPGGLAPADVEKARDAIAAAGGMTQPPAWIEEGEAADIPFGRIDRDGARAVLER